MTEVQTRVLLIDDHDLIRQGLARAFERADDFVVVGFILFLLVKGWNRLRRTPGEAEGDTELSVLREIREELKTRGPS